MRMPRIAQKPAQTKVDTVVPQKIEQAVVVAKAEVMKPETAFDANAQANTNRLEGNIQAPAQIVQKDVFADRGAVRETALKFAKSLEHAVKTSPEWAWEEKFALEYLTHGGDGSNLTPANYTRALKFAESLEPSIKSTPSWAWEAQLAIDCLKHGGDGSRLTKAAYDEALAFAHKLPHSSKTSPEWAWEAKYALDLLIRGG